VTLRGGNRNGNFYREVLKKIFLWGGIRNNLLPNVRYQERDGVSSGGTGIKTSIFGDKQERCGVNRSAEGSKEKKRVSQY
jgi:hypothetical protein